VSDEPIIQWALAGSRAHSDGALGALGDTGIASRADARFA
jgi:hypothetical protein